MNRKNSIILIICIAILAGLYFFNRPERGDAVGYTPPRGSDAATKVAISLVSEEARKEPSDIAVVEVIEREWLDTCLGLPTTTEKCLQTNTKGYEIILETTEVMYVVRTDKEGKKARLIE
jgi:hypothetical protein